MALAPHQDGARRFDGSAPPRIAIDAMGGDGGVEVTVPAALALAARAELLLVGDQQQILPVLGECPPSIRIVHASEVLDPEESLLDVLRHRPDSSMRQAILLHATGAADGVVSGGDTAALMALARNALRMIPGIERPAICKRIQGIRGGFWMLDLGANLDCTPHLLHQFARMGHIVACRIDGLPTPRIALLNIGTEAHKGPPLLHGALERLRGDAELNDVGFIEGSQLFSDIADVVVTDGFAGNVALKSAEGTATMVGHLLKRWVEELAPLEKLALWTLRDRVAELRGQFDPQQYNGASLIGLSGVVVKSHGSADAAGFRSALERALEEIENHVPEHLARHFHAGERTVPA